MYSLILICNVFYFYLISNVGIYEYWNTPRELVRMMLKSSKYIYIKVTAI